MIVANTKPGQLISVRNLLGIREFYLITETQDKPFKVRAYKALKGAFVYLDLIKKCKVVTKNAIFKN
tara:strand:+ start:170 stop:370 length:201 start_codon:yes stop_codon:yes gene_type:complete